MCRDEVKASLHIFHTRLVSFLVLKVDAFGAPFSAGRHHPPQRCYSGPPNFIVGPPVVVPLRCPKPGGLCPRHCWSLWINGR
jgi:hypothetical protein